MDNYPSVIGAIMATAQARAVATVTAAGGRALATARSVSAGASMITANDRLDKDGTPASRFRFGASPGFGRGLG